MADNVLANDPATRVKLNFYVLKNVAANAFTTLDGKWISVDNNREVIKTDEDDNAYFCNVVLTKQNCNQTALFSAFLRNQ